MDDHHPFNAEKYDLEPYEGPITSYMICSSPRCGSTLLGSLLQQSNQMGVPHEYFNVLSVTKITGERWGMVPPVSTQDYLNQVYRNRTTSNGIFGLKAHFVQLGPLVSKPTVKRLLSSTKCFIHITRDDILAQAVSYVLAHQTRNWSSLQKAKATAEYDAELINTAIENILHQNVQWQKFFILNNIKPLHVRYEDLLAQSDKVCKIICAEMGVETDHHFSLETAEIDQQRTDLNREWIERFQKESRLF